MGLLKLTHVSWSWFALTPLHTPGFQQVLHCFGAPPAFTKLFISGQKWTSSEDSLWTPEWVRQGVYSTICVLGIPARPSRGNSVTRIQILHSLNNWEESYFTNLISVKCPEIKERKINIKGGAGEVGMQEYGNWDIGGGKFSLKDWYGTLFND